MARLELTGVEKRYGAVEVLRDVNLRINDGEFIVLVGPSGCGKSTLLRMIAGLEEISEGEFSIDGKRMNEVPPRDRDIAMVFQSYALYPHMDVARNMGFSMEIRGEGTPARRSKVAAAAATLGLSALTARLPKALSGGQRQRVALARSIIAEPRLLLLDEPLSALDRNLRQQMQLELKALQARLGIAFVFVTHDQEEALTMSDRIVVMRAGKIEQIGPPRDIYRRPKNRFVADFIGETNLFDLTVERIEGSEARARTPEGVELVLPSQGLVAGQAVTAVLRPADFTLAAAGLAGTVTRAVYLGQDLHLFVQPAGGGAEIRVTARDGAAAPSAGDAVHLAHDPAAVHVLEAA